METTFGAVKARIDRQPSGACPGYTVDRMQRLTFTSETPLRFVDGRWVLMVPPEGPVNDESLMDIRDVTGQIHGQVLDMGIGWPVFWIALKPED